MKKTVLIASILSLAVLPLNAQDNEYTGIGKFFKNVFTSPAKKALNDENAQLKASLDSLQSLVDSLSERIYAEDTEELMALEGASLLDTTVSYTPEETDSLLQLWYRNSYIGDFDTVNEYDMDSVSLGSNISDEEMMRRLTAMNSFISLPYNSVVKNYIILYSERMPTRMGRVMGLSTYYFPIFEEAFNRYGLPVELKYMAVVESMLNPVARSRAGAMGIWQFMYTTGRSYGLEINSYVDERLDVVKAADAAARYLRDAYKIFGDWALAISSYNCGSGNVSKAIRRAGGKRDFWSIYPYLPRETRGYVPAFVGAMYAMTYYRDYNIVPQDVGMPARVDTFHINKNLHFEQINAIVGIPKEDMRNLNPQYVHDIVPGDNHTYVLKVPTSWTAGFVEADRDTLYAHKADSLFSARVVKQVENAKTDAGNSRITYKVKSGDYLGRIASRYGVSVAQLKRWNNLKSSNIRVGQILYIYGASPAAEKAAAASASSSSSGTGSDNQGIYTVKSGDSLYTIAKRYPGVSANNIKEANGLKSDKIRPGQKLVIPKP